MAYCGPRGIPHSWFLGGPYQWTELDRVKAIAWDRHRAESCNRCGAHPDDWIDPETGRPYDPPPHTFGVERCYSCEEREAVLDARWGPPDNRNDRHKIEADTARLVTKEYEQIDPLGRDRAPRG